MFTPEATIRRVNGEGVLLLGGGRALLMQVAHPAVARGVAEHSDYRRDPVGRLLRTLRPMYAIAFGTFDEAREAAGGVRRVHGHVAGDGYRADDPALLAWVLATLIDTSLLVHTRFLHPLTRAEREAYYLDMLAVGRALGMPPGALPRDLAGFEGYMRRMVTEVTVSKQAQAIARDLFSPSPAAPWLAPLLPVVREVTAGLLPPPIRAQYGLSWGPTREALLQATADLSRLLLPRVPRPLRAPPPLLMPACTRRARGGR